MRDSLYDAARLRAKRVVTAIKEEKDEPRESTGVFLRVSRGLASQFPSSDEDTSPPHCTLCYVGELTAEGYAEVVAETQSVCEGISPFVVEITDYGEFQNLEGQTIAHMIPRVVQGPSLAEIHESLFRGLVGRGLRVEHIRDGAFKPHVTLAYLPKGKKYSGPRPKGTFRVENLEVWGASDGVFGRTRVSLVGGPPIIVESGSIATPRFSFDTAPLSTMDLRDVARLLVNAARSRDSDSVITILDRILSGLEHIIVSVEGRPRGMQVARSLRAAFVELVRAFQELPESVSCRLNKCLQLLEQVAPAR